MLRFRTCCLTAALFSIASACAEPTEAPRVSLPVIVDSDGTTPCTTNLGYVVELTDARVVIDNFEFASAGQLHTAGLWRAFSSALVPKAYAHPGHYQGGEITGELRGHFVVDWIHDNGKALGTADLLVGSYTSANFYLDHATEADASDADDTLPNHTAIFAGTATRDGSVVDFTAALDSPDARQLVGAPLVADIAADSHAAIGFQLSTIDPLEGDTLFNDIDFSLLPNAPQDARIMPDATDTIALDAYNTLRRTLQTHDHFHFEAINTDGIAP